MRTTLFTALSLVVLASASSAFARTEAPASGTLVCSNAGADDGFIVTVHSPSGKGSIGQETFSGVDNLGKLTCNPVTGRVPDQRLDKEICSGQNSYSVYIYASAIGFHTEADIYKSGKPVDGGQNLMCTFQSVGTN